MYEAKLSSKNQIVIPRGARIPWGLSPWIDSSSLFEET